MTFAYPDANRREHLNLKEAAQEAWRGITAFVQGQPYLVIDKVGNIYTLEGEEGDILKLEHFNWEVGDEQNKLIAASRLEGSPLAEGKSFDGVFMGKIAFEDGRWEVLTEDGSAVVPIDEFVEHLASTNWLKAADTDPLLWLLLNDGSVVFAPVSEVHSHPGLIYSKFGGAPEYEDLYNGPYTAMGEVRDGQVHLSSVLPPDYTNPPAQWQAIKIGRVVRRNLKANGIDTSMTMTASAPGGQELSFPLYTGEKIRQVNDPANVTTSGQYDPADAGPHGLYHGSDPILENEYGSSATVRLPPGGIGGHTAQYFAQNGLNATLQYPPTTKHPEGVTAALPGDLGAHTAWTFGHWDDNGGVVPMDNVEVPLVQSSHTPEEIEQAMLAAEAMRGGRRGHVEDYEDIQRMIYSAHENGLTCPECGSHSMRALGVDDSDAQMKCLTCGNEWNTQVTKNDSNGKPLSSWTKDSESWSDNRTDRNPGLGGPRNLSDLDPRRSYLCPHCGEELDDGNLDANFCPYCKQELYSTVLDHTHGAMDKGSPYPSDSYKNSPDHTPEGQKKWPAEVNAVYNACMREGNGSKEKCAKIAWSQYEKTKAKNSGLDDERSDLTFPSEWDDDLELHVLTPGLSHDRQVAQIVGKNDYDSGMGPEGRDMWFSFGSPQERDEALQKLREAGYDARIAKTGAEAHQPGTRVEVQHPSNKGQRGSIVKHRGQDKAVGEDTYDVLLDNGEKAEGLRGSDVKRIKSAHFNSDEHFLETVPILPKVAYPGQPFAPPANGVQNGPGMPQSYPGYQPGQGAPQPCPNCGSSDTGPASTTGYSNPQMYACRSCGTVFQPKIASTKEALYDFQSIYLALAAGLFGMTYGKEAARKVVEFVQGGEPPEEAVSNAISYITEDDGRSYDQEAVDQALTLLEDLHAEGPRNHPLHSKTALNDVNGDPLTPGNWYVMHNPKYKVPDVVQLLNLEDNRIEGKIEGDRDYHFPVHIKHDEIGQDGYSFEPYTKQEETLREHTANDLQSRAGETLERVRQLMASGASQDEVKAVLDQYYAIIDQQNEQFEQAQQQQPAPNQIPGQPLSSKEARKNFTPAQQRDLVNENMDGRARNFDKLNLEGTHYESQVKDDDDPFFLWL